MILGKKVRLRAFREDDLKNVLAWINNPVVTRYLTHMRPFSMVEERTWLDRAMRNDDQTAVTFVVETSVASVNGMFRVIDPPERASTRRAHALASLAPCSVA